ncbi:MAG: pyridoxal phosphate-dependent aminotransferase [Phycisphaerae bacterium]|nr:pyridoxal phosphate-dependent aminotransferase [Phycisphaerae bacterium]
MKIASRLANVSESATLAIAAKAKAMKAQGIDVINFGVGEPDFDTPPAIKAACKAALDAGKTKYTPASGIPELKAAVCAWTKRLHNVDYSAKQCIITCGGKHALANAFLALVDPGDKVLIPAPYWVSYPEQVKLAGGVPVIVTATLADGFRLNPAALRAALKGVKIFVLNTPNNPGGFAYTTAETRAIADVLREFPDVIVFADEIYELLVYGGRKFVSLPAIAPELKDRTILFNGAAKTFSMTGWRIGWALGPVPVIEAMGAVQSQMTSNPTTMAQWATVEGLNNPPPEVEQMRAEFEIRGKLMADGLNAIPGVKCLSAEGAFYCFPDLSAHFGRTIDGQKITGSVSLAEALLEKAHVAVVPGEPFGADAHVRLSFACSRQQIQAGVERIAMLLK